MFFLTFSEKDLKSKIIFLLLLNLTIRNFSLKKYYQYKTKSVYNLIFKASALWVDAFYKSKCPSVCPSVRLFTFEVPFNGLCAPTSRSRMSNIFTDSESLGKKNGRSGLRYEHFCLKIVENRVAKKSFFLHFFQSSSVFGLF